MSGEVSVRPVTMRIDNLDLEQVIRSFDSLHGQGITSIIPFNLHVWVEGRVVNFILNYSGNRPSVTMSSEDPNILHKMSTAITRTFGGPQHE